MARRGPPARGRTYLDREGLLARSRSPGHSVWSWIRARRSGPDHDRGSRMDGVRGAPKPASPFRFPLPGLLRPSRSCPGSWIHGSSSPSARSTPVLAAKTACTCPRTRSKTWDQRMLSSSSRSVSRTSRMVRARFPTIQSVPSTSARATATRARRSTASIDPKEFFDRLISFRDSGRRFYAYVAFGMRDSARDPHAGLDDPRSARDRKHHTRASPLPYWPCELHQEGGRLRSRGFPEEMLVL